MSTTVNGGWLKNNDGDKFAPKTLTSQVINSEGETLDRIISELSAGSETAEITGDDVRNALGYIPANAAEAMPLVQVTAEDNGKFLRVVDGSWAATSIPDAEEASF